jgi:hypothetical protein
VLYQRTVVGDHRDLVFLLGLVCCGLAAAALVLLT